MVAIVALQASSTVANGQTPAAIASGIPASLSVISVMMPSVPSDPTNKRVRSYPADDFLARLAVLISSPLANTALSDRTLSFMVP